MGFLRGFSIALSANGIAFVLTFINYKLIYMYLSEADNGVFFLLMRSSMLLSLFFGDWLRLSSMNIAGSDRNIVPVLSANGFWYSVSLAIVLTVLFSCVASHRALGFSSLLDKTVSGVPLLYLPVIIVVGTALIARNNWQSLLLVNHRMFSYSFTFVLWVIVFLALDFFFLVIFKYGLNFVVVALIIATIASAVWAFGSWRGYSRIVPSNRHTFRPSWNVFSMSGKIGMRAWVAVLGMFLMINVHTFAIQPLAATPAEGLVMVAIFSICFRVFQLFQRGADVAGTVLYSHVVQVDDKTSSTMTMLVSRNIVLVSVVFAFTCALVGKTLIHVISSTGYVVAYVPLLIMLPGIVAVNAGSVINNYYWGRTYPLKIITAPYIATLIGLVLNIVLIPRIGVRGATVSFSVMSVVWLLYQTSWFLRDSGLRVHEVLVPRISDIVLVLSRINQAYHSLRCNASHRRKQ
jgi:O-antigen/teichoic acid export membrane protein